MSTPHPYLHFHARTPNPRSTPPLLQLYLTVPPPLGTATIVTTGHRLCVGPPRHQPMPRQAPASLDAALSPCTTGCHHNNADRAPPPRVASSPRATTVHHATLLMSDPFSLSLSVCVCVCRKVVQRQIKAMRRWWDPERRQLTPSDGGCCRPPPSPLRWHRRRGSML
jgi:hypothetical protein